MKHVFYLWNVVPPLLHYSMEPRQHKQRLRSNGRVTAANELRTPRVVSSLKIFLYPRWSLKKDEQIGPELLNHLTLKTSKSG